MKFAHMGDCHLGGWRYPELQEVNMQSFRKALDISIKEKAEMILISGDLFDSAYPPIEVLKQTFAEFKRLKDSGIPCFLIAGSHDYSSAGKTFLDVLEHAGFCTNVYQSEETENKIILIPTMHKGYALYGYPGKKSGLEIQDIKKLKLQDAPGFFKIFMLHTAIKEAIGNLPIESVSISELPKADYYAASHLHVDFSKDNFYYSGPVFPNNFEELEELNYGQFYLVEANGFLKCTKVPIRIKEVLSVELNIDNTYTAAEKIISELNGYNLEDKIILMKLKGTIKQGKISDINFNQVEAFVKEKGAYVFIRSISKLKTGEDKLELPEQIKDMHSVEDEIIKTYSAESPKDIEAKIPSLLRILAMEKQEDEKNQIFQDRLLAELNKLVNF
ncbi:MAG: exonuclease SbcCD subunit D [Candidatus Pacearchaeota archaeon]